MIKLTDSTIDYTTLTESVRSRRCGAVLVFLGTVRELTAGRRTVRLAYDAYPEMAEAQMAKLEEEARRRWPLEAVAIVHRRGLLELEEISVAIAIGSAHRADAFEAGRWLIDELKQVVPIWKKEHWADGTSEWVTNRDSPRPSESSRGTSGDGPTRA